MKVRSPKLLAFYRVASRCADIFLKKQITRSAAALSFFLTMSIFPFLICLNWMVGTLRVDVTEIASFFGGFIPKETLSVINDYLAYIENSQSLPMLIGGLVLMATTSSSAFRTIRTAMDDIYARSRPRPLWTWVFSFLASFVFLLSVYFCILILLTGGWFLKLLTQHFGIAPLIDHWSWIRFLVLFLFVLLMVYGLNRVAAPRGREVPRISVIGGALLTAFALVVVSILFSFFYRPLRPLLTGIRFPCFRDHFDGVAVCLLQYIVYRQYSERGAVSAASSSLAAEKESVSRRLYRRGRRVPPFAAQRVNRPAGFRRASFERKGFYDGKGDHPGSVFQPYPHHPHRCASYQPDLVQRIGLAGGGNGLDAAGQPGDGAVRRDGGFAGFGVSRIRWKGAAPAGEAAVPSEGERHARGFGSGIREPCI